MQLKDKLSEDHIYQLTRDPSFDSILNDINEAAYGYALLDIDEILSTQHGSSLSRFPGFQLPSIDSRRNSNNAAINPLFQEQNRLNVLASQSPVTNDIDRFNNDQRHVFDTIMQCIERDGFQSTNFARVFFL